SFNHARFVERTLRSVFAQTHAPAHLVVIDDGSRDDSARVAGRALASCPFPCELVARENRGLAATLNEGLSRAAASRYFAYLGSDDLWTPEFLRERVGLLERRERAVVAYGHCLYVDAEDRVFDSTEDWARYADGDARAMLWRGIGPHSPTVVYRRAAVGRYGWNERARLEDYELYLLLAEDGEFAFDARALAAWRVHGENTSRDADFMRREWLAAQRRVAARIGMTDEKLARAQRAIEWNCAEHFARRGEKAKAVRLLYHGWRGVPSPSAAAKMLLRFAAPQALVERRARRRRSRAVERRDLRAG
ncbi:MAG: glycosyltransferase family 2 protein, partial [Acidobacteria bacterium]|nr:glycosyltransferase family 2 protein [Acidobacteriota bacterium]